MRDSIWKRLPEGELKALLRGRMDAIPKAPRTPTIMGAIEGYVRSTLRMKNDFV